MTCPAGYTCDADVLCVPTGGSCACDVGDHFDVACALTDPNGRVCAGNQRCDDGTVSACVAPTESCNELDDDCDGLVDEDYKDARGAYSVDVHHCGLCGVDCTASSVPEGDLVCGGDAFSPSCVLACPDASDGVDVGDRVDGDRDIATGCECTVGSIVDVAGPVGASGEALDVNCDGADGMVVESFYVATDGDDTWPGSPTRPMKTIGAALAAARTSLTTTTPRPHVFVANGSYAEFLIMPSGVHLHGGYRRDFLALDPSGYVTEVRAPLSTANTYGQAIDHDTTTAPTTIAWMRFVSADAGTDERAAVAMRLVRPTAALRVDGCELVAGVPSAGFHGLRGISGASPSSAATNGARSRAAIEDANHLCVSSGSNVVAGGDGGRNSCNGVDLGGGRGGSPICPAFAAFAPSGTNGRGSGTTPGGAGGSGGQDSRAPISGNACPNAPVCCGLADFTVPTNFQTPESGSNGTGGPSGGSGAGCNQPWGEFGATAWAAGTAASGDGGGAGSGGGGGGGGGGVQFDFVAGMCAFPDGLGGGGGGGGAGGCGGGGGSAGTSGAPSVALLILPAVTTGNDFPVIVGNRFVTSDGGRGGDGGAGGAGGEGGIGAIGDEVPRAMRTTPTLAGPFSGGRGGRGGDGGSGGGGGGGCGGASVGVWFDGSATEPPAVAGYRTANTFVLGAGGAGGRGGGASGSAGLAGGARDVLARP